MKSNKPLSPSQLFKQEDSDLENLFNKNSKTPERIAHYKILSELGAGGMGKVYKAFDPQMNRAIAIKVILPDRASTKAHKRFIAEAKIMAQFRHPNIVTVYHVASEAGVSYIVMDFVEGTDLSGKELPTRQALAIIRDTALALNYAHQQGIIHRDLKPANLMLTAKDNKVVVMDFGLAKNMKGGDLTQSGAVIGTPRYMPPEQAGGKTKEISARTDIYALGAILYELLAGVSAITGIKLAEIMHNIFYGEVVPLEKHKPQLAAELGIICAKAMAKETDQRYPSAKAFAEDIDRFLQGEIIQAQAFPLWYRAAKKLKKHRGMVVAIVLSLLVMIGGLWALNVKQNEKATENLKRAKEILAKFPKEVLNINSVEDAKKFAYGRQIEPILEKHVKVLDPLRKTYEYGNSNELLLQVYKRIGLLALTKKNYILSQSVFSNFKRLSGDGKLLNLLTEEENRDVKRVDRIMDKAKTHKALLEGEQDHKMDVWEMQISRMKHPKVVQRLLPYVESDNWWQRLLAYRTLGKIGDKVTKVDNKDSVDWLLGRLKKLEPVEDKKLGETPKVNKEIEELIWTLGWLRDSRAEDLVHKKRWESLQNSSLWMKTKIPYRWIPLLKYKPDSAEAYLQRGIAKKDKDDFRGAIADCTQALALNPKSFLAYTTRGRAYSFLKEYKKAIADYNQAISLNKHSLAYNNRGLVYYYLKEYKKAIVDYNQAITLNPKYLRAYANRGLVYRNLREHQKAIADYTQAIALDPKYSSAYKNRGNTYNNLKEHKKAIADYNQVIVLNPKYSKAYNGRGNTYRNLKEYKKAIADYSQAITLNPKYSIAYKNRGTIYRYLKEYKKAIADYNQAIALDPKYSGAYKNKGTVYYNLKEYQKAIANYTQAIALNPKYSGAYYYRGTVFMQRKQHKLAASDFRKYLFLNPRYPQAHQMRAYIRQHSK